MILRSIMADEARQFNEIADHPMQSWQWGEFKKQEEHAVERVAYFDHDKMKRGIQVSFHHLPNTSFTFGYYPKGYMPDEDQLEALKQIGKQYNAIGIKMEPNIAQPIDRISAHEQVSTFLLDHDCVAGRPLFTKYTFILDLSQSEEKLFERLKSKTRYNVNLAKKKGVEIVENSTKEGMEQYIAILEETIHRQGFYAHTPEYYRKMWEILGDSGMIRIMEARYEGKVLVSWVLFIFNETLYYPYGASTAEHRDVMASNLMMWEVILFGKKLGAKKFDMWGALGPDPDKHHAWYGFHRFKEGYGGELYEFLGTYDLVLQPIPYKVFRILENVRWKFLRLKASVRRLF